MGNDTTTQPSQGFFGNLISTVTGLAKTGADVYSQVKGTKSDTVNSAQQPGAAPGTPAKSDHLVWWIVGGVAALVIGLAVIFKLEK